MLAAFSTLAIGIIIGYMGQRSRFCIISGIRDLFIVKDIQRFLGFVGLVVGAALAFMIFNFTGENISDYPMPIQLDTAGYLIASIVGGLGMGFFSVLAEGCPFRQHVMLVEGRESPRFYLAGFYVGIAFFYVVTINILDLFVTVVG